MWQVALFAQAYPQGYFRSPLDIPLNLAGNFGELRTNHFHSGIDIKTNQAEGYNVYSVAEGYISRIKLSPVGYGYALYVTHPNGYTTLYGHLQSYAKKIDRYVKAQQYKLESFSLDINLEPNELPVTKGELIGLSGNSGGSGGPHLHFEVRETVSEKVVNPLLFGFEVKDNIAPTISSVWLMPVSDSSWINGAQLPISLATKVHSGNCSLTATKSPVVYGDFGLAIQTVDVLNNNANRCGIYRIELFVDSIQIFGQTLDELDFSKGKAMNAHTYYEMHKKNKSSIHRSYRLPNNTLDIYDNLLNDGILSFNDGKLHEVLYKVQDVTGNSSTLKFKIQAGKTPPGKSKAAPTPLAHFDFDKPNSYQTANFKLDVDEFILFEDLDFTMEEQTAMQGSISPTYLLGSPYVAINGHIDIAIKLDKIKPGMEQKALLVRWDPDKDKVFPEGGRFEDGWLLSGSNYFGYFGVMLDTIAPTITIRDFAANMKGRKSFSLTIKDNLSDIDQIIPKIDGKWALMEYEPKASRLTYYFDQEYIAHGKHLFELTVIDERGNSKTYSGNFEW